MKTSMIILAISLGCVSANCAPNFKLSNRTLIEAYQNYSLVLECNTERYTSTVFQGNLLNCSSNEITLLHSRFNSTTGTSGTCNNGKVVGYSLPVYNSSNCYTSLLCIMVNSDMVGKTVDCVHDNGTAIKKIGNFTIPPNTTMTPPTATSVSTYTEEAGNNTSNPTYTHIQATKSLSNGEVESIIISCSLFLVGVMIIVIILSIFGFMFKKK